MNYDKYLTPSDITETISALVARNKLWTGKNVSLFFIVNKAAGCFTNKKKSEKYKNIFSKTYLELKNSQECTKSIRNQIFSTEYSGHATDLTSSIISQIIAGNIEDKNSEYLIVTAGGDGTSLEVQTSLFNLAAKSEKHKDEILNKVTIFRLPLGTGNDGTDEHTIEDTLELLKGGLVYSNSRAIKIYPENHICDEDIYKSAEKDGKNPDKYWNNNYKAPWYSFNIVSLGLDAFVVFMANKLKKKLPGNFYHLCIPLSGLLYEKEFPSEKADLELYHKQDESPEKLPINFTLMALGASGNRVYGGGHKILPDINNLCIVPKISLTKLIQIKNKFVDGSFKNTDLALLDSVEKIRISYNKPLLMQCDGETVFLSAAHFPLIMELTPPCIRILKNYN